MAQASPHEPLDSRSKVLLAIGLSWAAGFVDVVGYILLSRILSANMSGNTVEIPFHLFHGSPGEAAARGLAVLLFVAGLFACALIHEACKRRGIRSSAAITLGLEALLLAGFVVLATRFPQQQEPRGVFDLLLTFAAFAMGLQNATLTRVGALTVRTTHVTGMLTKFAESGSRYLFWFYDKTRGPQTGRYRQAFRLSWHHEDFRDTAITGAIWLSFLAGGFSGVWLHAAWQTRALLLPVALLVIFVMVDLRRPITSGE
jgi:uncharacterized membrane protein YoaK (UPF0700 family)